jgi:DNA-binding beta-propeller fold protein YncE
VRRPVLALLAAATAAGCGSASVAELPPAAGPARAPAPGAAPAGRVVPRGQAPHGLGGPGLRAFLDTAAGPRLAVLDPRARVLELRDPRTNARLAQAPAGVGPARVVAQADRLYVTDTRGDGLLVYATRPRLALVRRVFLAGGPYGLAVDPVRHRLWVTLTARNEVVSLPANGRPRPLVRLPTLRRPDAVAVDSATGAVAVGGSDARVAQVIGADQAYDEHGR